MYYEEDFHNQVDYDELDEISVNPNSRKMARVFEETEDARRHTIKGKNKKNIVVFSSGPSGSKIRNAVSGAYTNDIVGSAMEDAYYRVSYTLGSESKKLFYDSPTQYEKHFGCDKDVSIGSNSKKQWEERARAAEVRRVSKPSGNVVIR